MLINDKLVKELNAALGKKEITIEIDGDTHWTNCTLTDVVEDNVDDWKNSYQEALIIDSTGNEVSNEAHEPLIKGFTDAMFLPSDGGELIFTCKIKGGRKSFLIDSSEILEIHSVPYPTKTTAKKVFGKSATKSKSTPEGEPMNNRQLVTVSIIDPSAGIEPKDSLIKSLGEHVMDFDESTLKLQLAMDPNIKLGEALIKHNEKRSEIVDLDILQRTGNEVKLRPLRIEELEWVFK